MSSRRTILCLPLLLLVTGCAASDDGPAPRAAGNLSLPARTECAAPPLAIQGGAGPASNLRVEIHDRNGLHQGSEVVMVSDSGGNPLVTLECEGPFASFRLVPGPYQVQAFLGDQRSDNLALRLPSEGAQITLNLQSAPMPPPDGAAAN